MIDLLNVTNQFVVNEVSAADIFRVEESLGVMICNLCKHGVRMDEVKAHLSGERHRMAQSKAKRLADDVST